MPFPRPAPVSLQGQRSARIGLRSAPALATWLFRRPWLARPQRPAFGGCAASLVNSSRFCRRSPDLGQSAFRSLIAKAFQVSLSIPHRCTRSLPEGAPGHYRELGERCTCAMPPVSCCIGASTAAEGSHIYASAPYPTRARTVASASGSTTASRAGQHAARGAGPQSSSRLAGEPSSKVVLREDDGSGSLEFNRSHLPRHRRLSLLLLVGATVCS